MNRSRAMLLLLCVLVAAAATASAAAEVDFAAIAAPAEPTPILPFDDVRIGMKGYGLSVFHGQAIEPFAVEVISVMGNFAPRMGAIWIRCTDDRMQKSGPVSGMSGSPIYLWTDDEPRELGRGGKLIGAFAFGFFGSKDCYVGVQPIEQMRAVGDRAQINGGEHQGADAEAAAAAPGPGRAAEMMRRLLDAGRRERLDPAQLARAERLARLAGLIGADGDDPSAATGPASERAETRRAPVAGLRGRIGRLMLPMAVSSPGLARGLAPMLEPLGLAPFDAPVGVVAGKPPPGIDPQTIQIAPGSVLSIPLGWGDMDLSASGTVTDVLPDGRVLAFGHAMFGQGDVELPMASGFVHFIEPSYNGAFKLSGSGVIRGGVVRDENTAIVASPRGSFSACPVTVDVRIPGQQPEQYQYQSVQDRTYTSIIAAILTGQSLSARQNLPRDNTVRLRAELRFAGGRDLTMDRLIPDASAFGLMFEIYPPIASMVDNQHESMMLQSATVRIDVEATRRIATMVNARLDRAEAAPGDRIGVTVTLKPYGRPTVDQRVTLRLPQSLTDGQYELMVGDASGYLDAMFELKPHLGRVTTADELHAMIQRMLSINDDAIYLVLKLHQQGLAIGREELPRLPSSRAVMIAAPTSALATPYIESVEKKVPTDTVVVGRRLFVINVRRDLKRD